MWRGEKTLAAFRPIARAGDSPDGLFTLREGWAAVCPDMPGQPLRATEILLPGDRIGLGACIWGKHRYTVVALTPVRYCVLDCALPERLAERGGALGLALMRSLIEDRSRRERMAALLGYGNPIQRLAYLFLETFLRLKTRGLADETMCPFPLRRNHIAEIVGLSEVHVSRTLAAMRKEELIDLSNNILIISDRERLASVAGLRPAPNAQKLLLL